VKIKGLTHETVRAPRILIRGCGLNRLPSLLKGYAVFSWIFTGLIAKKNGSFF